MNTHRRHYDFSRPLDDSWEMIPEKGWTFDMSPGRARFANTSDQKAEIYLRPCCIEGDTTEFRMKPGTPRKGIFHFGFIAGFEFIKVEVNLEHGGLRVNTHEFHKAQPRFEGRVKVPTESIQVIRESDRLPGLPYSGSSVRLLFDGQEVARVGEIDFLPESMFMFGLKGPGEITLASFSIAGPPRPRPEYVRVGIWQQQVKPSTAENVDGLVRGVREAADAGVQILVTPETSLTGLRPDHPELNDHAHIQSEVRRFQDALAKIKNAPYTMVGYPDWIPGSEVDGATLDHVKVNSHRFVRPDGSLGPLMAKVHSCEEGLWHGRKYNLQRVCGVEVAVGICHDGHYQDVWSVGVMGGARLCIHALCGGTASGPIVDLLNNFRGLGDGVDSFWVRVNAGGGSGIMYPVKNRKHPDTILAVPPDLTKKSKVWPDCLPVDEALVHANIRLWEATGAYPMRTLRGGKKAYESWSGLIPKVLDV